MHRLQRSQRRSGVSVNVLRYRTVAGMVLLVLCLALIAGCGFKLRGMLADARHLPEIFVRSERGSSLAVEILKVFHQAGVRLVDQHELATWVLTLSDEQRRRRVLSVGVSGKVQEYELQYSVNYTLYTTDEHLVIDTQPLILYRDYSFTGSDVLAKEDEEELLYQGMQQQAAEIILRQLLINNNKQSVSTEAGGQGPQPNGDRGEADRAL